MSTCGLDFGTSNTTLGVMVAGAPVLVTLEGDHTTIPSAVFYEAGGSVRIGRRAIEAYVDAVPGRLLRSLKSVLGSALINEVTSTRTSVLRCITRGPLRGTRPRSPAGPSPSTGRPARPR